MYAEDIKIVSQLPNQFLITTYLDCNKVNDKVHWFYETKVWDQKRMICLQTRNYGRDRTSLKDQIDVLNYHTLLIKEYSMRRSNEQDVSKLPSTLTSVH